MNMHQIKPHPIWIGHAGDGCDFKTIFAEEIRAIVQLAAEEPPVQAPKDLVLFRFPLLDAAGNDPDLLHLAITSVAASLKMKIPAWVCCGAGISRSPAIVAAALTLTNQTDLKEGCSLFQNLAPLTCRQRSGPK